MKKRNKLILGALALTLIASCNHQEKARLMSHGY